MNIVISPPPAGDLTRDQRIPSCNSTTEWPVHTKHKRCQINWWGISRYALLMRPNKVETAIYLSVCHGQIFAGFSGLGNFIYNIIPLLKKEKIYKKYLVSLYWRPTLYFSSLRTLWHMSLYFEHEFINQLTECISFQEYKDGRTV